MVDQEIPRETDEPTSWIDRYGASRLAFKRETTRNTYTIILRQFLTWLSNLLKELIESEDLRGKEAS